MKIVEGRAADLASTQRSAGFTGVVWGDPVLERTDGVVINNVFFTPGARTDWHIHESGQVLNVTSGQGRVGNRNGEQRLIRTGDTVWIEPGEEHWHGADAHTCMAHQSISLGDSEWLDPVTDAEYQPRP